MNQDEGIQELEMIEKKESSGVKEGEGRRRSGEILWRGAKMAGCKIH